MKTATHRPMERRSGRQDTQASGSPRQAKAAPFVGNRLEAVAQRDLANAVQNSPYVVAQRQRFRGIFGEAAQLMGGPEEEELLQGEFGTAQLDQEPAPAPKNTALPDGLKSGVESLSGMSMDGVKVHYNSSAPAHLNALAYAQGSDIHVAPGQEQHLPHEFWHVVQQAQGRVKPTWQTNDAVPVNDDKGLEHEADVMGARAAQLTRAADAPEPARGTRLSDHRSKKAIQRKLAKIEGTRIYIDPDIPGIRFIKIGQKLVDGRSIKVLRIENTLSFLEYSESEGYFIDGVLQSPEEIVTLANPRVWAREQAKTYGAWVDEQVPTWLKSYSSAEIISVFTQLPQALANERIALTTLRFYFQGGYYFGGYAGDYKAVLTLKVLLGRERRLDADGFELSLKWVVKHASEPLNLVLGVLESQPSFDEADAESKLRWVVKHASEPLNLVLGVLECQPSFDEADAESLLAWAYEQAKVKGEAFFKIEMEKAEAARKEPTGKTAPSRKKKQPSRKKKQTTRRPEKKRPAKKREQVKQPEEIESPYDKSVNEAKEGQRRVESETLDKLTRFFDANVGLFKPDTLKAVWQMAKGDEKLARQLLQIIPPQGNEDLTNVKLVIETCDPLHFAPLYLKLLGFRAAKPGKIISAMVDLGSSAESLLLKHAADREIDDIIWYLGTRRENIAGALTALETIGYADIKENLIPIDNVLHLKPIWLVWLLKFRSEPSFGELTECLKKKPELVPKIREALDLSQGLPRGPVLGWCCRYDIERVKECLRTTASDGSETYTALAIFYYKDLTEQFRALIRLQGLLKDDKIAEDALQVYQRDTIYRANQEGFPQRTGFLKCRFPNDDIIYIHTHWNELTGEMTSMHVKLGDENGLEIDEFDAFRLVQEAIVRAHNREKDEKAPTAPNHQVKLPKEK